MVLFRHSSKISYVLKTIPMTILIDVSPNIGNFALSSAK